VEYLGSGKVAEKVQQILEAGCITLQRFGNMTKLSWDWDNIFEYAALR
jgi:hypothetical protein